MRVIYNPVRNTAIFDNELRTIPIGRKDIVDIYFQDPDGKTYRSDMTHVVDLNDDSMYIDTENGDICGWVKYDNILSISLVGHEGRFSDPATTDMVNHPQHYKSKTGLETIDVIEAFTFDLKGIEATDTGNILKYVCRWKSKNGLEDLKKARWYLDHLINHVEKLEKENEK